MDFSNEILGALRSVISNAGIELDLYALREKARGWNKELATRRAQST